MTVETPELPSELLDLTSTSLSEIRSLRDPALDRAVRRTLDRFRRGRAGDSVQSQANARLPSVPM
ncbi:hypothetical protein [Saccharothrix longispora]|uniref:hypothetical protein n=1 Tax=Saccharothrix longispora TaxID=33920 RepID=UPI0028FDB9C2|nr:hypothetical protein [Saccharothrix longispora]MDU0289153.1 hypothetical protein [Saccharothrix longispora]